MTNDRAYTYLDLAHDALQSARIALTVAQIWSRASEMNLVQKLTSTGKKPLTVLSARLYESIQDQKNIVGRFKTGDVILYYLHAWLTDDKLRDETSPVTCTYTTHKDPPKLSIWKPHPPIPEDPTIIKGNLESANISDRFDTKDGLPVVPCAYYRYADRMGQRILEVYFTCPFCNHEHHLAFPYTNARYKEILGKKFVPCRDPSTFFAQKKEIYVQYVSQTEYIVTWYRLNGKVTAS